MEPHITAAIVNRLEGDLVSLTGEGWVLADLRRLAPDQTFTFFPFSSYELKRAGMVGFAEEPEPHAVCRLITS